MYEITALRSLRQLEAIRDEWASLWNRCTYATAFQRPEWLLAWWRHFGKWDLWSIALRSNGRLSGLAPLFIQDRGKRILSFIGTGITDYMDVLLEEGAEETGARELMGFIFRNRAIWDHCHLEQLRDCSPLAKPGEWVHENGFIIESASYAVCPVISLPENAEQFECGLSRSFRMRVRRAIKNAVSLKDGIRFETATRKTLPEFMDALFSLHVKWWQRRNATGILSGRGILEFHSEISEKFMEMDMLRLYGMRYGGRLRAVVYAFACRDRIYSYIGGFDPDIEDLSPGTLIIQYAVKEAIREGFREFDFLRGGEKYKYLWSAKDRLNRHILIRQCRPLPASIDKPACI